MKGKLTKEEKLKLDISLYNKILIKSNPNLKLTSCEYCGRLMSISCICDEGQQHWQTILDDVEGIHRKVKMKIENITIPSFEKDEAKYFIVKLNDEYYMACWKGSHHVGSGYYTAEQIKERFDFDIKQWEEENAHL